ncbi:MAG: cytochrome b [Acetobacteraceae bacterium]|nr:cytochrome b [Acetobacteraceae bacterium]
MQRESYDPVAKTLHWVVVGLVTAQFVTKLISPGTFAGVTENGLNAWHLAVGPTILLVMLLRLAWRLTHTPPPPPQDIAAPLQLLSLATHWAFYGLLIIIPVLGWLSASGYGAHPTLMFLFKLPAIVPTDKGSAEWWGAIHGWLAWLLLAVIALHVSAATWHGLARDDGVFARMMPGRAGQ